MTRPVEIALNYKILKNKNFKRMTAMQNEYDRLMALRNLRLLDTIPSANFDRITRLAANYFDLPVAAVSLTDTDRQWFKSKVGVEHNQIPRYKAPCAEVAETCKPLVIRDFADDTYYADSTLGQAGIRFYCGVPLVTPDGHGLGALCVLGTNPADVRVGLEKPSTIWVSCESSGYEANVGDHDPRLC
jgi:GAF domain-containing protein